MPNSKRYQTTHKQPKEFLIIWHIDSLVSNWRARALKEGRVKRQEDAEKVRSAEIGFRAAAKGRDGRASSGQQNDSIFERERLN